MAQLGAWESPITQTDSLNDNRLYWSEEVFRIFGYEPGEVEVSNELFLSHVPQEDRPRIEKAVANPNACKDEQGRLRVAAATTVGDKGYERTQRLIEAGVDLVVVDTAHGHSQHVLNAVNRIKRLSNKVQVVAGNVATADGAKALPTTV